MSRALPPVSLVRRYDTRRLIPTQHSGASVLARIADDDAHLAEVFGLDHATNDRLLAETGRFEDEVTFDEYPSDFSVEFHDLRGAEIWRGCLDPDSYRHSQALAERAPDPAVPGVAGFGEHRADGERRGDVFRRIRSPRP